MFSLRNFSDLHFNVRHGQARKRCVSIMAFVCGEQISSLVNMNALIAIAFVAGLIVACLDFQYQGF